MSMSVVVKAGPGDTADSLIRKFQKRVVAERLIPEIRKKEFYKKPAELRQEYLAERRRKIMRARRLGT